MAEIQPDVVYRTAERIVGGGAASAAQARLFHLGDEVLGGQLSQPADGLVAAPRAVGVKSFRLLGHAPREQDAFHDG